MFFFPYLSSSFFFFLTLHFEEFRGRRAEGNVYVDVDEEGRLLASPKEFFDGTFRGWREGGRKEGARWRILYVMCDLIV